MKVYGEHILDVQPPLNWQLEGTSAWINMLTGVDDLEEKERPGTQVRM